MTWYIAKRLGQMIPVFLGATFLIFAMVFLLPGDPIAALGGEKGLTPAVESALRTQYHLDQPFLIQYWEYLKGIFTLDFGQSFSGRSVTDQMAEAFPVTIKLALLALVFEAFFGVIFGLIAGLRRGGIFDGTVLFVSLVLIAVPLFVLGFVAQFVLGVKWGIVNPTVGGNASLTDLLVPAIVLGSTSFAYVVRLTRTTVAETATADWVRTATAKGLSRPRVVTVHILRNSLIPVVTYVGADLAALMGGAVITEGIFNIPGVGGLLYKSVTIGEAPTVVSVVTILVVVYMLTSLVVDLLYALLDPRIRYAR